MSTIDLRPLAFTANEQDIAFAAEHLPKAFRKKNGAPKKVKPRKRHAAAHGQHPPVTLFHALLARGMVRHQVDDEKWAIDCPFGNQHTSDSASGTVIYSESGKICCLHAHCTKRSPEEYRAAFTEAELAAAEAAALGCLSVLPAVVLTTVEHEATTEVIQHLSGCPDLYVRGGRLVTIVHSSVGTPGVSKREARIVEVTAASLRDLLTMVVTRVVMTPDGPKPQRPPKWLTDSILARRAWPGVRQLNGIVMCPVLRPDGTVLDQPGYDGVTGLYFYPERAFTPIPQSPELEAVAYARAQLLDLSSDFPFAAPAGRSGWLALIFTLLAQYAFEGPAPAFVFDGTNPGTGKGLLTRIATLIGMGDEVPPSPQPGNEEEERKSITSLLLEGGRAVLRDNVTGVLGSGALEALLTSTKWKDRLLGSNTTLEVVVKLVFIVTANNVKFRSRDMIRRSVPIRLESPTENPEQRTNFKYQDLPGHVRRYLDLYVWCALVMLRAYAVAGYPAQPSLKPWGSFEGWSRIVRGCVVWCGLPDPAEARDAALDSGDTRGAALRELLVGLEALLAAQQKNHISSAELLKQLDDDSKFSSMPALRSSLLEDIARPLEELGCTRPLNARKLGNALGAVVGTVAGGRRLRKHTSNGTNVWSVEVMGGSGGHGGPGYSHLYATGVVGGAAGSGQP